jgi:hypothetical protein
MRRWSILRDDLQRAATPNDLRQVDRDILADLATIHALGPAHDALTQFGAAVTRMQAAGLPVALEATELAQAQQQFATGATAADFTRLTDTLRAALLGMVNDQAQAIPYLGAALISGLRQRVDLAGSYGEPTQTFRAYLTQDQTNLTQATSLPQYLSLADQVGQQTNELNLPLMRGQARQDLAQLQALIEYCQQQRIPAYEYASDLGIGSAQADFAAAQTFADFQAVDGAAAILLQNLRAAIANYTDATPHDQPHTTDLALMRSNQVMQGKVIVISLREQTARLYANGQLALWTYITTGRPERPSPPGVWHILDAQSPITFVSGDNPNSPLYYQPTTIHFALLYHDGGFYIHDAWWRLQFGPGSNLPHDDPQAFNGGSHGCVNVPLQQMAQIYQWTPVGTPVIVY